MRKCPALRGYRLMKYFPTLEDMLKSAVASVQVTDRVRASAKARARARA